MANPRRSYGLQVIFSFFLGLMVTAFVGVGVYTFHSPPDEALNQQIEDLNRAEQTIRNTRPAEELNTEDRNELQGITAERNELRDAVEVVLEPWMRSTSIILILFATLVMAISLVRAEQLPVISNGLLLGGVFTMVYGVGWIVATDTSISRFIVMTVALAITLALGYIRFVRTQKASAVPASSSIKNDQDLTDIDRRLSDVEERLDIAASALSQKSDKFE